MNLLYHAAAGALISESFLNELDTKVVAVAVLPDLVGVIPGYFLKFTKALKSSSRVNFVKSFKKSYFNASFIGDFDKVLYRTTHSLLVLPLLVILFSALFKDIWPVLLVSYLSHILIDIPTHRDTRGTRIFYPISDFSINGRNWWLDRKIFLFMWGLLVVIFFISKN